ncbi:hypothetical protein CUC43_32285 (plasmid) [Bacillus thuringiensis LM1212]|uniref:hypothetical protein n=1 Tax=Bacillus thuringiensis TaxID=1428 RepID=UPI000495DFA3|nr:hypothetical protein [Bacillus thuringiensis]AXY11303.1 hypothetical protein CUC43_32285 [Bacillus thuringiensis LM1212]
MTLLVPSIPMETIAETINKEAQTHKNKVPSPKQSKQNIEQKQVSDDKPTEVVEERTEHEKFFDNSTGYNFAYMKLEIFSLKGDWIYQWVVFNVTNIVKVWISGERPNYGFKLHPNGRGQNTLEEIYCGISRRGGCTALRNYVFLSKTE